MNEKNILRSKTFWASVVTMIVPWVFPWAKDNPEIAMGIVGAVNVILRLVTKDKVKLK